MRKFYHLLLLLLGCTVFLNGPLRGATLYTVTISGTSFTPDSLSINVGDTVQWTNSTGIGHNVNGTTATFPGNPESFGNSVSTSWTYSYVFNTAGIYDFQCDPHSGVGMTGQITVNSINPAPCTEIFFSEYVEGSNSNKALEVYNPTSSTIDLADYTFMTQVNGGTGSTFTYNFTGTIEPGGVYVIANSSAWNGFTKHADTLSSLAWFNGDDVLTIINDVSGDTIDRIGIPNGNDPGANYPVAPFFATSEFTLVRHPNVLNGNIDTNIWLGSGSTEWLVYAQNDSSHLGGHVTNGCLTPQVSFWPSTYSGCSTLNIELHNTSTAGNLFYWDWEGAPWDSLGMDVNVSVGWGQQEITLHAYDSTGWGGDPGNLVYLGSYTEIIDAYGSDWAGPSTDSVCPGSEAAFNHWGYATSFFVDFGDGQNDSNNDGYFTHLYDSSGSYSTMYIATNPCGADTFYNTVVVDSNAMPDPFFRYSPSSGVACPNSTFWFRYDASESPGDQFTWDFGDGTPLVNGVDATHAYADTGWYIVEMIMTNGCGNSRSAFDTLYVSPNAPFGNMGLYIPDACPNSNITSYIWWDEEGSPSFSAYYWDFGDGTNDSVANPLKSYADTGIYTVSVTVTNGCGVDTTLYSSVNVSSGVIPYLDPMDENYGIPNESGTMHCPGDSVLFFYGGSETVFWEFGDGDTATANELLEVQEGEGSFYVKVVRHAYADTGTYTARIIITNGCGNSDTATVDVVVGDSGSVSADFVLDASPQGGNYDACQPVTFFSFGGGTYRWDFGDGDTLLTTNGNAQHTYSEPGTYSVQLLVTNGCGNSDLIVRNITIDGMYLGFNVTNAVCASDSNGSIDMTVNNGMAPYNYSWGTEDISGLSPNDYTITVTDDNGCSVTDTVTVGADFDIQLSFNSDSSTCGGSDGSVMVAATGGDTDYDYLWSPGSYTTDSVGGLSAGVYSVVVTDSSGCTANGSAAVNTLTPPSVNAPASDTICAGDSIQLTGSGTAVSYTWDNGVTDGDFVKPTSTTTYTVIGDDGGGCQGSDQVTISVNPIVVNTTDINNACVGDNEVISGSASGGFGSLNYAWTPNSNINDTTLANPTITVTTNTSYSVTVTDALTGCMQSGSVNVTVSAISVDAGVDQDVCDGESLTLAGSGATSYSWTGGITDNVTFTPTGSMQYVVTGTDGFGCTDMDTVMVTVNSNPTVSAGSDQEICGGDSVTLSGSGATSYTWDNGVTDGVSFAPASTNSYVVTGTDGNGCTGVDTVTITVNPAPTPVITVSGLDLSTDSTMSSYQWYVDGSAISGATTSMHTALVSGSYTVEVTDSNDCTGMSDSTVVTVGGVNEGGVSFEMFPNPSTGLVKILLPKSYEGSIVVYDAFGKEILNKVMESKTNVFDISGQPNGVYMVEVTTNVGKTRKKLVLIR